MTIPANALTIIFTALLLAMAAPAAPVSAEGAAPPADAPQMTEDEVFDAVRNVYYGFPGVRIESIDRLISRGNPDVVPGLIPALRFIREEQLVAHALEKLTGASPGHDWAAWQLWLEEHPEIKPFPRFDELFAELMVEIDKNFRLFLKKGVAHEIRLEEIAWGGVRKDGIPALNYPKMVSAAEAVYLKDDELVFGVSINGDVRAYPLRQMDWHEMFNDTIGGVDVTLAYCALCGSGILFETRLEDRPAPLVFGSSGFLYRSNKLMYDQGTHSLWNQFTGRPVVGELVGSGIELKVRPVAITSWKKWRNKHPATKVLSLDTGYIRDYRPGLPYGPYFASPDLMFPASVPDTRLKPKEFVFALRLGAERKAWPLSRFDGGKVLHGELGGRDLVLIGNRVTRTVRAYEARGRRFTTDRAGDGQNTVLDAGGGRWRVTEDALVSIGGRELPRLPGHIAYWFAWQNFIENAPLDEK